MTARHFTQRLWFIVGYEPSWFAESGSGLGIVLWSIFVCLTDDFHVHGWAWLLPLIGLVAGPLRMLFLFRLSPVMRVTAAMFGALWWGWLAISLFSEVGVVPSIAGYLVGFYGDALTLLKFSAVAWRLTRPEAYG